MRPCDEIAFGDHETGFVIACLRQAGDQRRERITTLGNVWIVLDVVGCVEALHCRGIMLWNSEVIASSTSALLR